MQTPTNLPQLLPSKGKGDDCFDRPPLRKVIPATSNADSEVLAFTFEIYNCKSLLALLIQWADVMQLSQFRVMFNPYTVILPPSRRVA